MKWLLTVGWASCLGLLGLSIQDTGTVTLSDAELSAIAAGEVRLEGYKCTAAAGGETCAKCKPVSTANGPTHDYFCQDSSLTGSCDRTAGSTCRSQQGSYTCKNCVNCDEDSDCGNGCVAALLMRTIDGPVCQTSQAD